MSEKEPKPTEDKKADPFLVRFSVVVLSTALLASVMASINLANPNTGQLEMLESMRTFSILGWPAYLVIIYLAGRIEDAFISWKMLCGTWLPDGNFFFAGAPAVCGVFAWIFGWFAWRIPYGIRWVVEFFGS